MGYVRQPASRATVGGGGAVSVSEAGDDREGCEEGSWIPAQPK